MSGACLVSVWVRVWFVSGSCLIRGRLGSYLGLCRSSRLVRDRFRDVSCLGSYVVRGVGFVSSACLVSDWVHIGFVSGS